MPKNQDDEKKQDEKASYDPDEKFIRDNYWKGYNIIWERAFEAGYQTRKEEEEKEKEKKERVDMTEKKITKPDEKFSETGIRVDEPVRGIAAIFLRQEWWGDLRDLCVEAKNLPLSPKQREMLKLIAEGIDARLV